ncbi:hypothetical protein F0344_29160 [Streptomyces finlayi]|uniref:Nucleopolyhedrovirus P10 family protein n=1 Tax=Streptomyces finlayi TaxID=67296 RepID=A0A7G7BS11_9ACTN|nr:hypothetical protein [Streptomyces finlayi]QNE78126.1 hypothetical protein F0344_29160 [Streptomyces finlayi]
MTTAHSPQRADKWTAAVRQRLGLGRLLPLGGPGDGTWIAERAADAVLREAAAGSGAVLGKLRIGPVDPGADPAPTGDDGVVPAPPSAYPAGPLRIEAEFSATMDQPLPAMAEALRSVLLDAARQRLGMVVTEADLRVTELLDTAPEPVAAAPAEVRAAGVDEAAGAAASSVPGVVALTQVLGSAVHTDEDHVRVEVATAWDHRALDVAQAVRTAVTAAVEGRPPVGVLITAVVAPG